jgi:ribonuclease J
MSEKVRIVPLGGLGEIGKNMTVIQYEEELYIIDAGVAFPDADMFGVDVIIPDFDYLRKHKHLIKAIFITHAHEDHIGALSYFLKEFQIPLYATKLTMAIIKNKLKNNRSAVGNPNIIDEKSRLKLGACEISFFPTNHSIPDAVGIVIKTPIGSIVHTGDFKIDYTPIDGKYTDFQRLGEIGKAGVLALLSDSTNAEKSGTSISEKLVGENLLTCIKKCESRVIVSTFSSSIHRVQNLFNIADKLKRKVIVLGKSMENNVKIASKLGYLTIPENILITSGEAKDYTDEQIMMITTGAQGEVSAGLSRMAYDLHDQVKLKENDTVILSSSPIPGNEKQIFQLINVLLKKGVKVIHREPGIHTSGHGNQDEQKLMLSILRPKYFIPVHGEYSMQLRHSLSAQEIGISKENIFLCENGDVIEFTKESVGVVERVQAGDILVDNSGMGDVDIAVMKDRKRLSEHGVAVIHITIAGGSRKKAKVRFVLKGIVSKVDKNLLERDLVQLIDEKMAAAENLNQIKKDLYNDIGVIIYKHVKRKPMIILTY